MGKRICREAMLLFEFWINLLYRFLRVFEYSVCDQFVHDRSLVFLIQQSLTSDIHLYDVSLTGPDADESATLKTFRVIFNQRFSNKILYWKADNNCSTENNVWFKSKRTIENRQISALTPAHLEFWICTVLFLPVYGYTNCQLEISFSQVAEEGISQSRKVLRLWTPQSWTQYLWSGKRSCGPQTWDCRNATAVAVSDCFLMLHILDLTCRALLIVIRNLGILYPSFMISRKIIII